MGVAEFIWGSKVINVIMQWDSWFPCLLWLEKRNYCTDLRVMIDVEYLWMEKIRKEKEEI